MLVLVVGRCMALRNVVWLGTRRIKCSGCRALLSWIDISVYTRSPICHDLRWSTSDIIIPKYLHSRISSFLDTSPCSDNCFMIIIQNSYIVYSVEI